jgi:hypothetical protein
MSRRKEQKRIVMQEAISFLPPIQVGYEIYYESLEIEGIHDRQAAVWQFVQGSNHALDWEQEPTNPQNPQAIKIFGISEQMFTTKQELLGYVPADVAKQIVDSGLWPFMQLRLDSIYAEAQGLLAIRFQVLGPIRKKKNEEITFAQHLTKEEEKTFGAIIPAPASLLDREAEISNRHRINMRKIFFFILRTFTVLIGMGLGFIGGKMGTAVWQNVENLFSPTMLFPVFLVISGALLIWIGIKPSKPIEDPVTGIAR